MCNRDEDERIGWKRWVVGAEESLGFERKTVINIMGKHLNLHFYPFIICYSNRFFGNFSLNC